MEHGRQPQDEVRGVQQEGDEVPEGAGLPVDAQAADDQDDQERALYGEFDGGTHDRGELRGAHPRAVGRIDACADAGRLAFLCAVHADHRQGAEGAFEVGGEGADRVLHVRRRAPDAREQRGDDEGRRGHGAADEEQQQRIQPQHDQDGPCGHDAPRHHVDQGLRYDLPEQRGVGRHPGNQVAAPMPVVLPHLQPEQPPDEPVPQLPHDAFAHSFQEKPPGGPGRGFAHEQRAQERQRRPGDLRVAARVDDVLGDERLGQTQRGAHECEHGGQGDRVPVSGGEPVHRGHRLSGGANGDRGPVAGGDQRPAAVGDLSAGHRPVGRGGGPTATSRAK